MLITSREAHRPVIRPSLAIAFWAIFDQSECRETYRALRAAGSPQRFARNACRGGVRLLGAGHGADRRPTRIAETGRRSAGQKPAGNASWLHRANRS